MGFQNTGAICYQPLNLNTQKLIIPEGMWHGQTTLIQLFKNKIYSYIIKWNVEFVLILIN